MKSLAKRKSSAIKNHKKETGGGPPITDKLTNDDEKILEMIGTVVVEGDSLVLESACNFEFDNVHLDNTNGGGEEQEILIVNEIENVKSIKEENSERKIKLNLQQRRSFPEDKTETPLTSHAQENVNIISPQNSLVKKKNEKIRVQRLDKAQEANNKLLSLTEKKITLYKRDVEAKESIAKSLDLLVNYYIKKSS